MLIRPEIFTTPDCPIVKFRESAENINLDIEIQKVLQSQGWGLGTIFSVQFINHDRTELIKTARYVVISENSDLRTFNPDSQSPMTKQVERRQAKRMESWFYPNPASAQEMEVKWNVGEKEYQVKRGEEILFSSKDKKEAEKYKEAA